MLAPGSAKSASTVLVLRVLRVLVCIFFPPFLISQCAVASSCFLAAATTSWQAPGQCFELQGNCNMRFLCYGTRKGHMTLLFSVMQPREHGCIWRVCVGLLPCSQKLCQSNQQKEPQQQQIQLLSYKATNNASGQTQNCNFPFSIHK